MTTGRDLDEVRIRLALSLVAGKALFGWTPKELGLPSRLRTAVLIGIFTCI
jgi:hypothetical protein